ncbi:MAG: haloacid dehalogenase type II [Acidiferrobacterales bacterium]
MSPFENIRALTFDVLGTVLDLGGSLTPYVERFLKAKRVSVDPPRFWEQWRYRQRIEQFQDSLVMLGHSGYLETARRALVYTLRLNGIEPSKADIEQIMQGWQELRPFPDVVPVLPRLAACYRLVALSNGSPEFLAHLAKNRIKHDFHETLSVDMFGAFKPHPSVYRGAARRLGLALNEIMMVSAHAFDIMGARACGYHAVYVNRYALPYDDTPYLPDVTVKNFTELADVIL